MAQVLALFPTPLMQCPQLIDAAQAQGLRERFILEAALPNHRDSALAHSRILDPAQDPALAALARRLLPEVVEMGRLMFGEALPWAIKEMWANVL